MDEIVGLVVEQIAKSAREAAERKRLAPKTAAEAERRARDTAAVAELARRVAQRNAPPPAAAPGVPASAPAPAPAPAPAQAPAPAAGYGTTGVDAVNPFGDAGMTEPYDASADASPFAVPSSQPLLRDFSGGTSFVGAFIVGEALAPPVALREPRPF